mgnify:CR=1 FL=1
MLWNIPLGTGDTVNEERLKRIYMGQRIKGVGGWIDLDS